MKSLINYIRSCFCKHDWELLFNTVVYSTDSWGVKEKIPKYYVKVYHCKKCGMEKKYKSN